MRAPRLFLIWGFLTGFAAGLAYAAPPSYVEPVGEASENASFTFNINVPALVLSNLPDGSSQVRIDGFAGHQSRPGVPDLPFTVVHVAIPPGVTPRLVAKSVVEDRMPGAIPRPVARETAVLEPGAGEADEHGFDARVRRESILEADPAIFGGREPFPKDAVSLGAIGTFRDQRYVDVVISPVRFDPSLRGLRVARTLTITIAFDGDTGARAYTAPDPRIEDLYRDMFANYAQGSTFRLESSAQAPAPLAVAAPLVGPRYRIRVRANGPIRLDLTRLSGTGFESQPLSSYKLSDRGVEVPLLVFDANSNDVLDSGDWIQFYGQALDDEPKTVLTPGSTNIYELRDYSDENVYFLTAEPGARSRLQTRNAPPNLSVPATKFDAVAHMEIDNIFRPLGAADPWYWGPLLTAGTARTESVPLPGLASGTDPARVLVRLRGRTEDPATYPDHKSKITLLNSLTQVLTTNNDDGTWDGRTIYTHDFTWTYPGSGNVLSSPAQVRMDDLVVAGSPGFSNDFYLDFIEVRYKRNFQATGDTLTFDYPDGDSEFQITAMTTNTPEIWEITGRVGTSSVVAPVRVTGASVSGVSGNYAVRFHMTQDPTLPDGTLRRFVVAGSNGVSTPAAADFTADTVSDLRNTSNQADLIVIAHPTALGPTSTATLNSLLSWKLANQGITSKVVMLQDVYDEFGDGLLTPQAIKSFLAFTQSTNPGEGWSGRKPAWVLLIGDGSYDSKYNDTTVPPSNLVPTQIMFKDDPQFGYYASDSILADVSGDDLIPDLVIGRISTRTDAQTQAVLQKIYDYESNPPLGAWRSHAVFVSDRGKDYSVNEALEWESTNAAGVSWLKIPPYTQRTMRYWTDYCMGTQSGCSAPPAQQLRPDIKNAVNGMDGYADGTSIMQYIGHGNFNVWSDDYFFAEGYQSIFDVSSLHNGSAGAKYPWLIVHNCLSAGFMDTNDVTMGEDWLKRAGGGAMAVFAPSGLTDAYNGVDLTNKIYGTLFGQTQERILGNAVAAATNYICGQGAQQACQNYVLLGDPSTRMVFQTIQPATALVATPGNDTVQLTWNASATSGVHYDIYRATPTPANYQPLYSTDVGATGYTDSSATNMKPYFYYVIAVDSQGYESRWSNYNSDCAINGPDCVSATPTNPNPPAVPTGLAVTDPETGAKLNLSWTPNASTDEIDHYTVWWGTNSGNYTQSSSAGKLSTFSMTGLVNGQTYFVAITATNTSGHTSTYSTESSGTPSYVRGVRSPHFVATLKIDKSGSDAVLSWAPVTTDIYGKPTTIAYYEVFRGTTPTFMPGPGTRIGQPTTPTLTDPGVLSFASSNYYYLVRAVDVNGNVGGAGNQLPNGIDTMTMTKTPDGAGGFTLGLSWPAVTTDFDGQPLTINHYEVYVADHAFSRGDITGMIPVASPTSPSYSVTAPAANQYYSVLAVDARGNKSSF
jgi:hypothetical protein